MASDIQANLAGPLPKTYVELGIAVFGGFVDFFKKDVAAVFASVNDPALQKDLTEADNNAAVAMSNLSVHLTELRKTATDNFALGKDLYAQMVKDTEQVDLPIEQIEARGPRRSRAQYRRAQGGVRELPAEGYARRLRGEGVCEEAGGGDSRCGAPAARHAARVRAEK